MLADRTKFKPSKTSEIFQKIPAINKERMELGLEVVIDLGMGQPHLPINPLSLEAIEKKLQDENLKSAFGYSPLRGRTETLEAITQLYKEYYPTVDYGTDEVMCTQGASQALWNAFSILIQEKNGEKDKVLTFMPYFALYETQVTTLGGEFISIPTYQTQFRPSAQVFRKVLSENSDAKVMVINYPNNPSGVVLTWEEYQKIAQVLADYPNIVLILDEVYRCIHFKSHISILDVDASLKNRTIVINSASKGLIGAPDMRIGMVAAPAKWITAMSQQQLLTTLSVPLFSQIVLSHVIKMRNSIAFKKWEQNTIKIYKDCLEMMYEEFTKIGFIPIQKPEGGFYLLVDASCLLGKNLPNEIILSTSIGHSVLKNLHEKIGTKQLRTDSDIAAYLLYVAGVAMVPASGFGIDATYGYLRASYAVDKAQILKAIQKISQLKNPETV